jgi:Ca2+-binding RTX toxin-like protein
MSFARSWVSNDGSTQPTRRGRPAWLPSAALGALIGVVLATGAASADTIRCKVFVRCHGTEDADLIIGTDYRDVIEAHGGNDDVSPYAGADENHGQAGHDVVTADGGSDFINGGDADDRRWIGDFLYGLQGWLGGDEIHGAANGDLLRGEAGDDFLDGGSGVDTCSGGDGNDSFRDCEK